ncbi:MAG: type B 50S ribosomal protein L31 [Sandaracinus sp.]|nr:type B 50S ribosomal protein L31 [Sandaracinus sp.]MCB9622831.1 type B 50S ribosomal protein L31 [Sandaracinus sp.]MCB9633881.1 type B 50S ribosomal protein L31 [Sandaracinus sp.]
MKPDIHPDYHPVIFVDDDNEVITRSTATSKEKRVIDGVEHDVIRVDVSAFSHPFYTGRTKVLDTEGRVERFKKRYAKKG